MRYHVVTTTNAQGWEQTGRRMAQSFVDRWPDDAKLTVYAEGFEPDVDGVEVRALPAWMAEFKAEHGRIPACNGHRGVRYDYRFDAVKFAHKVAALTDFAEPLNDGVVIWLDADIYTHSDVTEGWLGGLFPAPAYLAWLDRSHAHPECGFVMYRASHPHHSDFMAAYRKLYTSGDLFKLPDTNDCTALAHIVHIKLSNRHIPPPVSLSGAARRLGHVLANSALSQCIDHMKGDRKRIGRTPKNERVLIKDGHPYWA